MPDTLIICPVFDHMARTLTGQAHVQHIDGLPTSTYLSDFNIEED